jgi:hypothetical protein
VLFSAKGPAAAVSTPKPSPSPSDKKAGADGAAPDAALKKELVSIIDGKRSYNVAIALARFRYARVLFAPHSKLKT